MQASSNLSMKIIFAMLLGILMGILLKWLNFELHDLVMQGITLFGEIFIKLMMILVVPVVFVSIICGIAQYEQSERLRIIGFGTLGLYILTTMIAIAMAIMLASFLGVGQGMFHHMTTKAQVTLPTIPSFKTIVLDMIPTNPLATLASGSMLSVIILACFFGVAMRAAGESGQRLYQGLTHLQTVLMRGVMMVLHVAPYGVFCLLCKMVVATGLKVILHVMSYALVLMLALLIQMLGVYGVLLGSFTHVSPLDFFKRMWPAMLFAFSVSSSSASIPVVMKTVREKLKVSPVVAGLTIPLGATLNMDGTAIMQGVATVFIANAYGVDLSVLQYVSIIIMATLASIGTAGVPGVGLITLTMVLSQVGLPVDGIAMILGVDRLLDMMRTAVNICGDAMVACVIDRFQGRISKNNSSIGEACSSP